MFIHLRDSFGFALYFYSILLIDIELVDECLCNIFWGNV